MKKWLSRKLFAFVATTIAVPFLVKHNIPTDTVNWLIGLAGAYIGAEGAADAITRHRTPQPEA